MGFDFGSLDKNGADRQIDNKEIKNILDKFQKRLQQLVDDRMKSTETSITMSNNEQMTAWHDAMRRELSLYKENVRELWSRIYPTIVKMWGTKNGIGKTATKLDMLLEDNEKK